MAPARLAAWHELAQPGPTARVSLRMEEVEAPRHSAVMRLVEKLIDEIMAGEGAGAPKLHAEASGDQP